MSYEIIKCIKYYGKSDLINYVHPRLSWKLLYDRKTPIDDSLFFLLFFSILLFLHPPASGTGRQIKQEHG